MRTCNILWSERFASWSWCAHPRIHVLRSFTDSIGDTLKHAFSSIPAQSIKTHVEAPCMKGWCLEVLRSAPRKPSSSTRSAPIKTASVRVGAGPYANVDAGVWQLHVYGKNGVTVKDTLYTPTSPPVTLHSGDVVQVGDKAFFFLLEKGTRMRDKMGK